MVKTREDAQVNGDINIVEEINKLIRMFNKFISQAILLLDKAEVYGDNLWAFDADADKFYILDNEKEELTSDK